jgi:hypothetical protein
MMQPLIYGYKNTTSQIVTTNKDWLAYCHANLVDFEAV